MSPPLDWAGLMQAGLARLGLEPAVFWRLTPIELRMMLGIAAGAPPLTRARLAELAAAFPDQPGSDQRGPDERARDRGERGK